MVKDERLRGSAVFTIATLWYSLLCWGYMGIMEKKMETTIMGYIGFTGIFQHGAYPNAEVASRPRSRTYKTIRVQGHK